MTLLYLYRAESHWSNPQRIRETTMPHFEHDCSRHLILTAAKLERTGGKEGLYLAEAYRQAALVIDKAERAVEDYRKRNPPPPVDGIPF